MKFITLLFSVLCPVFLCQFCHGMDAKKGAIIESKSSLPALSPSDELFSLLSDRRLLVIVLIVARRPADKQLFVFEQLLKDLRCCQKNGSFYGHVLTVLSLFKKEMAPKLPDLSSSQSLPYISKKTVISSVQKS